MLKVQCGDAGSSQLISASHSLQAESSVQQSVICTQQSCRCRCHMPVACQNIIVLRMQCGAAGASQLISAAHSLQAGNSLQHSATCTQQFCKFR